MILGFVYDLNILSGSLESTLSSTMALQRAAAKVGQQNYTEKPKYWGFSIESHSKTT